MARARDELLVAAFASVLRQTRTNAGLSQEELAFRADVNRTFVGLLEGGKRQPTLSVIFALARELKLTPEALVQKVRRLAAERSEQA
jgi:transcriptional regulator with XRE-family HTH domain